MAGMLPELITPVPGPESLRLAGELREVECRNITWLAEDFPVFWERAEGANVWDADGNRYLDLTSGFGVATAGFGNEIVVNAFREQSGKLYHAMGDVHPTELKVRLCRELAQVTYGRWGAGAAKVILGNSGFEAVEGALKTAFLATGKPGVIAFEGGYHGLGYGALAATALEPFQGPFRKQLKEFARFLPFPRQAADLAALRARFWEAVAENGAGAVLVEPVQGRGGEIFPPAGFLKMLRELADESGAMLIFDEIYTGFFRTGSFFACETEKVVPDLICVGKALSGAFPISACVGRAAVMDAWPGSDGEALHTSTFLGNPVGCAVALASIGEWKRKDWGAEADALGKIWEGELRRLGRRHPEKIREIRGRGLLWGMELGGRKKDSGGRLAGHLVTRGLAEGLIVLGGGEERNVLSITPSFALSKGEVAWAAAKLGELLERAPQE